MGGRVRKIKNYTSDEIKALISADEKYRVAVRLYAVYLVSLGMSSRKLGALYNTSSRQILNWVSRFEEGGVDGLYDKKGRGRKSRLSEEQKRRIKELVVFESPRSYGYVAKKWSAPFLRDWIEEEFGVEYKGAQIYNLLKSLGLCYQKSKGYFPKENKKKDLEVMSQYI